MGLDNGIRLKSKMKIDFPYYLKICESEHWEEDAGFAHVYDICYWRKCFNIRNVVFEIIGQNENQNDEWLFEITSKNCKSLVKVLEGYLEHPETWDEDECLWSFDEFKSHLLEDIINLSWLADFLKENTKCYAEFYDSY